MKRGQLLRSSDEATPAKRQHTRPCADCPWARTALNGWLGGLSAAEWVRAAHGEGLVDCHTKDGAQCAGAAIYRANVAKLVRDPRALRLPADRKRCFSNPTEFTTHHSKAPS